MLSWRVWEIFVSLFSSLQLHCLKYGKGTAKGVCWCVAMMWAKERMEKNACCFQFQCSHISMFNHIGMVTVCFTLSATIMHRMRNNITKNPKTSTFLSLFHFPQIQATQFSSCELYEIRYEFTMIETRVCVDFNMLILSFTRN